MKPILSYLPLSEPTYYILLSLAPGLKHGYAILKDVDEISAGRVRLSTSTLYGAIKRLLELGWIERVEEPLAHPTERERKAYALTPTGRSVLEAETERLSKLVSAARLRAVGENP